MTNEDKVIAGPPVQMVSIVGDGLRRCAACERTHTKISTEEFHGVRIGGYTTILCTRCLAIMQSTLHDALEERRPKYIFGIQDDIDAWAHRKGWKEGDRPLDPVWIGSKLELVNTELSEACEDVRTGTLEETLSAQGKPVGFPTEIADAAIRIFQLAGSCGVDLERWMHTLLVRRGAPPAGIVPSRLRDFQAHLGVLGDSKFDDPADATHIAAELNRVSYHVSTILAHIEDEAAPSPERTRGHVGLGLARAMFQLLNLCTTMGIVLDEAIERKMAYNERRSHRHGGKAI